VTPIDRPPAQSPSLLMWLILLSWMTSCATAQVLYSEDRNQGTEVNAADRVALRKFTAEDALGIQGVASWTGLALSPDGRWLAYTIRNWSRPSASLAADPHLTSTDVPITAANCDVWLTDVQTGKSKSLTNGHGSSWAPVWSPSGNYLAFYSDRSGAARIWLWERESGQLRQVSDAVRPSSFTTLTVVRWTQDDKHLIAKTLPARKILDRTATVRTQPASPQLRDGSTVRIYESMASEPRQVGVGRAEQKPETDLTVVDLGLYAGDLVTIDIITGNITYLVRDRYPIDYWLSFDGSYLAFTDFKGRRVTGKDTYDLGLFDFAKHSARVLASDISQEMGMAVSWSPDSRSLAYLSDVKPEAGVAGVSRTDCFVVSVDAGEPRNVTDGPHPSFGGLFEAPLWDKAGSLYLTVSSQSTELGLLEAGSDAIWKTSAQSATATKLATVPGHRILGLVATTKREIWSPDGGNLLVVGTQDESTRQAGFWTVDTSSGKTTSVFEDQIAFSAPSDFTFSTCVSQNGHTLVYLAEDAQHPQTIWITGSKFDDRRRLTNLNPQLTQVLVGSSRPFEFESLDGVALHGALLLPPNYEKGKRYATIVWLYGGTFMSREVYRFGLESATASLNLQILASHGYVVVVADAPTNVGTPGLDLMKTIMPAVDSVVRMGIADENRLGIMGHSYGAYSTLIMVEHTNRFKAAAAYAGVYDLMSSYGTMVASGNANTQWAETGQGRMGGTPWQHRERYIENSPVFYLDRIETPLLLVHGDADSLPSRQAEEVFVGLRRLGSKAIYAKYAGEGHVIANPANVVDYWNRLLDWFDKYLEHDTMRQESPSSIKSSPE
jgi:dipeptidyl aminopeptidase/acylaminoacyl peptidase